MGDTHPVSSLHHRNTVFPMSPRHRPRAAMGLPGRERTVTCDYFLPADPAVMTLTLVSDPDDHHLALRGHTKGRR
ncbi:hypothetical protein MC885_015173, partial [Smutsia gigantea]